MNLDNNLDNIKTEYDLFGDEHKKLSMPARIGFYPLSVWQPDWRIVAELKKIVGDKAETRVLKNKNVKSFGYWKKGGRYRGSMDDVSIFNPHLAQMILSAYCPVNANVLDIFGGGGTRGFIASAMGHKYTGIEIRQEEVVRIKKQQNNLKLNFEIVEGDSQNYPVKENYYDFSYTCPPYFNLEIYSDNPNDLSNAENYNSFLVMLKNCLITNYKAMKKDSLTVWVIGNFRDKKGYLTHFSGDLVRMAKEVGYNFHDEIVFWKHSTRGFIRTGGFQANRKCVREHEYLIILKK